MFVNMERQGSEAADELRDTACWAAGLRKAAAEKVKEHPERRGSERQGSEPRTAHTTTILGHFLLMHSFLTSSTTLQDHLSPAAEELIRNGLYQMLLHWLC